ncbi:MAG: hypothetical protein HDT18_08555 [Oscillibacter sp.]|nr:hypothetical protein [Oscillibacter sp.]
MSIKRVRACFARYGAEDRIHEFSVSSAAVELALTELEQYAGTTSWVDVRKAREG